MKILQDKKSSRNLLIVILLLYFIVYFGRYSYNASIVNIIHDGVMTKTQSGILSSAFYIFFAIGSLLSVKICNKTYTYIVLFITTIGTAIANLGFYFSNTFYVLVVFYSFNAICQSLMFTPIFTIINTNIQSKHRQIGVKYFSLLYPLARLFDNIMIVLCILIGNYKYLFLFAFFITVAVSFIWFFYWHFNIKKQYINQNKKLEMQTVSLRSLEHMSEETIEKENPYKDMSTLKLYLSTGFFIILIISFFRAALNNGTNTWVPTIIMETFETSPLFSQITTLVFPLLNVFGIYLGILTVKKLHNEILVAGIYFLMCALPFTGLLFMKDIGFLMTFVLFSLINVFSYSFFYVLNSRIAARYRNTKKVSAVSSMIASTGSIAFIASSFLFGKLSDVADWNIIIIIWVAMAVFAAILCFSAYKKWGEFQKYN